MVRQEHRSLHNMRHAVRRINHSWVALAYTYALGAETSDQWMQRFDQPDNRRHPFDEWDLPLMMHRRGTLRIHRPAGHKRFILTQLTKHETRLRSAYPSSLGGRNKRLRDV
jgi:hypothetical protein